MSEGVMYSDCAEYSELIRRVIGMYECSLHNVYIVYRRSAAVGSHDIQPFLCKMNVVSLSPERGSNHAHSDN